jgi:fatty-acyl-CoA synthase
MNIALLLSMMADAAPDRIAVGSLAGGVSYAELRQQAASVAGNLADSGATTLALVGANSDAVPALLFGSALAQLPFCSVNYRLADDRLRDAVARTAPSVVVADDPSWPRVEAIAGTRLVSEGKLLAAGRRAAGDEAGLDGDSPAVLLFTSGTTGEPKIVVLRHRHLFSYVVSTTEFCSAEPDQAALISVPSYHIAGIAAILTNVYAGRRVAYLPQFSPEDWVSRVRDQRITHAMIVPTMLGRILDVLAERQLELPTLRHLSYGGGRTPVPVVERAMAMLPHVNLVNAYGLTETSSTIALLSPADHRAASASADPAVRARLGSAGRPVHGVEIEVRDASGSVLPPGDVGEIYVRGDQIAGEYADRSAVSADGWFCTRDRGRQDGDGYLFLDGRADDVIVRGGENLSPAEIEQVLLAHPAVADAGVAGIPDEEWGEVPAAAVVLRPGLRPGPDELRNWVRDQLRSARTPVLLVECQALPYNEAGKLLRRVLRSQLDDHARQQPGARSGSR